jgi:hypothetical protein
VTSTIIRIVIIVLKQSKNPREPVLPGARRSHYHPAGVRGPFLGVDVSTEAIAPRNVVTQRCVRVCRLVTTWYDADRVSPVTLARLVGAGGRRNIDRPASGDGGGATAWLQTLHS